MGKQNDILSFCYNSSSEDFVFLNVPGAKALESKLAVLPVSFVSKNFANACCKFLS